MSHYGFYACLCPCIPLHYIIFRIIYNKNIYTGQQYTDCPCVLYFHHIMVYRLELTRTVKRRNYYFYIVIVFRVEHVRFFISEYFYVRIVHRHHRVGNPMEPESARDVRLYYIRVNIAGQIKFKSVRVVREQGLFGFRGQSVAAKFVSVVQFDYARLFQAGNQILPVLPAAAESVNGVGGELAAQSNQLGELFALCGSLAPALFDLPDYCL